MSGVKEFLVLKATGVPGIYRVVFRVRSFKEEQSRAEAERLVLEKLSPTVRTFSKVVQYPVPASMDVFGYETARVVDFTKAKK
jgi:5-hydroxyisourate hydrolase-like protein (transthyretin family)